MEHQIYKIVKTVDGQESVVFETVDYEEAEQRLGRYEAEAEHNGSFTYVSYDIEPGGTYVA